MIIISLLSILILNYLFFSSSFYADNEESFKWILGALNSTKSIDVNDENSNYSFLFQMLFLPNSITGLFFGEGKMPLNSSGGSDIGYIRHIFIGGIVLLFIEFSFLFYLFKRCFKNSSSKSIILMFLAALLIANFKGDAFFVPSGFFRLFILYYVFLIANSSTTKNA
jgi:hypothetical protein